MSETVNGPNGGHGGAPNGVNGDDAPDPLGGRIPDPGQGAATATAAPPVAPATFPDLGPGTAATGQGTVDLLADVDVTVTVELGKVRMRLRDLLALREGSVLELDAVAGGPVDVLVNGTLVARGEVVVVGDDLGVRVSQIVRKG